MIYRIIFSCFFLQSCVQKKLTIISYQKFYQSFNDTLLIKSLSVIDRYQFDSSMFKKPPPPFLIKNREQTREKLENLIDEITVSGRYEYSYPFVLQTIEDLISKKEFPILFDKNFSYKNDSLFKPLLNDSIFNTSFDTSYLHKIVLNVNDGIHVQVTVLRRYFKYPTTRSGDSHWLYFYFEFFYIRNQSIYKYTCIKRERNGGFVFNYKNHSWRINDKDTRLVFEKLFKIGDEQNRKTK